MQILYVMQGAPGSGKSTIADAIETGMRHERVIICSTDDFFGTGAAYRFDPTKLSEHHAANLARAVQAMDDGLSVIVDNTNIQRWTCREYVRHAHKLDIPVVFIRCTGNFQNIHGVPLEAIERMRATMEELTVDSVLASKCPWEN